MFSHKSCVALGVLAFINCWNVEWSTRVQDIFTYAKLLALFVIICTGVYQLFNGNNTSIISKESNKS